MATAISDDGPTPALHPAKGPRHARHSSRAGRGWSPRRGHPHPDQEHRGSTPAWESSSKSYTDCWATFTGYPLVANWSLATDSGPLFEEALRVLALKTAVFELSGGDEHLAELEISAPVDEMVHAVLAQYTLCQTMTTRLGIRFVHMTDQERFTYQTGGYTDQCYAAAGWGEQDRRYWLDRDEMGRRLDILGALYTSIGFQEEGRSHTHDFTPKQATGLSTMTVAS